MGRTPFTYTDFYTLKETYVSKTFSQKDDAVYDRRENKLVPVTLLLSIMRSMKKLYFSGISEEEF